ncbi:MAG: RNA methyltransferase [Desulfotignum sp.]|jgi:tRNA (guanine37-N1)-methyltransferase|nr:RNA methyltransferase [Desulfotignum sp.]
MDNLYLALVHFPVVNKKNEPIGSALTTIDLHDMARASMTFGVRGFYVVTPFQDQADLADQVIRHWTHGTGGRLNPSRKQALELVRVTQTFEAAVQQIYAERNQPVVTIATSAKKHKNSVSTRKLKQRLGSKMSHVLVFGTAWGLAQELMDNCDLQLDPITGTGAYNHLSVRSAASIYLDRLTND